jgi:hypothetical protein
MGVYTVLDDKRVDETITKDLQIIVDRITTAASVRAIILGGGFGRGEGSVVVNKKGIRPVNDYDIFVIVSDDYHTNFRPLSKEIAKKTSIRLIDLIQIKYSDLPTLVLTQLNYDLKYGGLHLWGENILDIIPQYKESLVNKEAGRSLLLNRLICAIEAFSERFRQKGMNRDERFFLVNQTGKVVSACVEALLIKKNKYHYSYRKRQEIFEAEFPERTRLCQLNSKATEFKLQPTESPDFDAIVFWDETIKEYIKVIAEYLVSNSSSSSLVKELWRLLKKQDNLTNNSVERVELMLLLYRVTSFFNKRAILAKAHKELENILKTSLPEVGWESLRDRTARLWHELYH